MGYIYIYIYIYISYEHDTLKQHINGILKDENIGNHEYIGTLTLWIYPIYWKYIIDILEKNIDKPEIDQNSWKCKKNFIKM